MHRQGLKLVAIVTKCWALETKFLELVTSWQITGPFLFLNLYEEIRQVW